MPIAIQPKLSESVRQLAARQPNLTSADLAATTGDILKVISAASARGHCDKPKSRTL